MMVIYVTLINLQKMRMYLSTITEALSFALFMSLKIFNFGQIKINMCGYKTFKYLLFSEM